MSDKLKQFRAILEEIFQLNQADLDFGIYRIMNQKRDEITRFLDHDLLPQVEAAFAQVGGENKALLEKELETVIKPMKDAGATPDVIENLPKVKELRERLIASEQGAEALADEVFSRLTNFFGRYYKEGDFISLPRYKDGVYAIPYNGEEVKLHWANADQYYIKTTEHFKDYVFKLDNEKLVHFKIVDASTEQNNNKEEKDKDRRFILDPDNPVDVENDELVICFIYQVMKTKQNKLNEATIRALQESMAKPEFTSFVGVWQPMPTEKNPERTLLEKHLNDYTSKNSFDYFIHKDLGSFLRRELDFYIKNEVMYLDDLDTENEVKVHQYLNKIKVIKRIGHKIIAFLAQLEDFQKKLWLKKKFVVETNYCLTLDRVPQEFYGEISTNQAQLEEWKRLFAVEEIENYAEPLTVEFLQSNPYLVLDTAFFSPEFKERLLASMDDIDGQMDGLLVHSENFQALQLLQERYREQVKCIYIDPPYNTGNDDFLYKDNYQDSSWLCCIDNRLSPAKNYFTNGGTIAVSIDLKELDKIIALLDYHLGSNNRRANISIRRASISGAKVINPGPVNISENVIIYSNNKDDWQPQVAYREKDYDSRYGNVIINPDDHFEEWRLSTVLEEFAKDVGVNKRQLKKHFANEYEAKLLEYVIENAHAIVQLASLDENSVSAEAVEFKQKSLKNPDVIMHLPRESGNDYYMKKGKLILFYKDRLRWVGDKFVPVEPISDIWDDVLPNDLHNEGKVRLKKGKKPEKLINRIFESTTLENDLIMDYFAGSATSAAVALKSNRKFINIESSEFFDNITLERLKNTLFGDKSGITTLYNWKGGGAFKYIRLESYEDTLNNLELRRSEAQQMQLDLHDQAREEYLLSYMLDLESQGSQSLLNLDDFSNPFDYKLNITRRNESRLQVIDLPETFNYLLGLTVRQSEVVRGFKVVRGELPNRERALIIWRNLNEKSNQDLEEFMDSSAYNPRDNEFDRIYINGDNHIENRQAEGDRWKVLLIEEEFKRLMFDVRDI